MGKMAGALFKTMFVMCLSYTLVMRHISAQQVESKVGNCPPVSLGAMCATSTKKSAENQCTSDNDCAGIEKCCQHSCTGKRCTDPVSPCICPFVASPPGGCTAQGTINCHSSADCNSTERCCATECGGSHCIRQMKEKTLNATRGDRCPPTNPLLAACSEPNPKYWGCHNAAQCASRKQKCCLTNCKGRLCVDPVKVGNCPVVVIPPGTATSALDTCGNDAVCPFQEKCCSYGEGVKCQCPDYSAEFNVTVVHLGVCPLPPACTVPPPGGYTNLCQYDTQCLQTQKCCSFCGHKCVDSVY